MTSVRIVHRRCSRQSEIIRRDNVQRIRARLCSVVAEANDLLLRRVAHADHNLCAPRNGLDGAVDQRPPLRVAECVELAETPEKEQPVQPRFHEMIDMPLHVCIVDAAIILQNRDDR